MANFTQENNYMLNNLAAQSRQEQQPGPVQHAEQTNDYLFTFTTENGTRLLLHALSDKILRFRYLPPGSPAEPDFSYAVPSVDDAHPTFPRLPTFLEFDESQTAYCLADTFENLAVGSNRKTNRWAG